MQESCILKDKGGGAWLIEPVPRTANGGPVPENMTNDELELRKFDADSGLDALYDDWLALVESESARCFYNDPDWFRCYLRSRAPLEPPVTFFGAYRAGELVAVLPLQRLPASRPWGRRIVRMPVESQLQLPDCAVRESEDAASVIAFILDRMQSEYGWNWDSLVVGDALEDSRIAQTLERLPGRSLNSRQSGECSVVPLRPYDETLAGMKAKFRQNLNRARRMIAALDDADFSIVTRVEDVDRVFQEFIELEAAGWKGGKGKTRGDIARPAAIALNAKKRRFHEAAVHAFAVRGAVEIFCVRAAGKLIGAEVWLVTGETCYALKTAYDEAFRKLSPGVMAFDLGYQQHAGRPETTRVNTITATAAVDDWLPEKIGVRPLRAVQLDAARTLFRARRRAAPAGLPVEADREPGGPRLQRSVVDVLHPRQRFALQPRGIEVGDIRVVRVEQVEYLEPELERFHAITQAGIGPAATDRNGRSCPRSAAPRRGTARAGTRTCRSTRPRSALKTRWTRTRPVFPDPRPHPL